MLNHLILARATLLRAHPMLASGAPTVHDENQKASEICATQEGASGAVRPLGGRP